MIVVAGICGQRLHKLYVVSTARTDTFSSLEQNISISLITLDKEKNMLYESCLKTRDSTIGLFFNCLKTSSSYKFVSYCVVHVIVMLTDKENQNYREEVCHKHNKLIFHYWEVYQHFSRQLIYILYKADQM